MSAALLLAVCLAIAVVAGHLKYRYWRSTTGAEIEQAVTRAITPRHYIVFTMWDATIEHPEGEQQPCHIVAMVDAMRLGNGQMQVQGTYRETVDGRGFERVGA